MHIPRDPATSQSKGLAYVTFAKAVDALAAFESLDKTPFQGRLLHILAAVDRRGNFAVEDAEGSKKTVKDEKSAQRKATSGKEFNWGMLYMNARLSFSHRAERLIDISAERRSGIIHRGQDEHLQSCHPQSRLG